MKFILTIALLSVLKLLVSQTSLDALIESFEDKKYRDLNNTSEIIQNIHAYTKSKISEERVKAYTSISDYYALKGQFTKSLLYLDSAAKILETNNIRLNSNLVLKKGILQSNSGANYEALELYKEALVLASKEGPLETANVYLAIGEILRKAANYDMATKYLDSAQLCLESVDNSEIILARIYNRKAAVLNETGNTKESIKLSNIALNYAIKTNNLDLIATSYNEIGYAEWHLDKTKGLDKVLKAAKLWSEIGKNRYEVSALLNAVKFYLEDGAKDSAVQLLNRCDSLVNENPWYGIKAEIFKNKDLIARSENNFKDAYEYHARYHHYNNLYFEALKNEKIQRIQYDFRLKEKDADIKSKEKLLATERKTLAQKEKINKKLMKRERLIIVLLIIAVILFLSVYWSRKKVIKQSAQIEEKNVQLNESLENQSFLLREIHHRVKNNLQVITSLLEMQSKAQENEKTRQVLLESRSRVVSMNLIHSKLYQQENLSRVQMEEYIISLHREIAILYKTDFKPDVILEIEPVYINTKLAVYVGIMLNELITNSYKYAINSERSFIKIVGSQKGDNLHLSYEDSGPGFDYELFEKPKPNSIGLRIIKNMLRQLNAEFDFKTNDGIKLSMIIKEKNYDPDTRG